MAGEPENGANAGTDDLRSTLAAAYAEHEGEPAGKANGAAAGAAEGGQEAEAGDDRGQVAEDSGAAGGGKKRGPDGRFAKADGEAEDKAAEAPEADQGQAAAPEGEAQEQPAQAQAPAVELPASFSAKDKADFATLAPEGQRILKDMVTRQTADYQKKTQAVAELRREYEPVDQLFAPHREAMKAKGFTPSSLIRAWASVEEGLVSGRGVEIIRGLVDGYKLDRTAVARALGLSAANAQADGDAQQLDAQGNPIPPAQGAQAQLPPELAAQLRTLSERQDAIDRERADAQRRAALERETRAETEIQTFRSSADDKGNLLHPHFDDVEQDMVRLANSYHAARQPVPPLKELYETAVWANPSTREKLRTAEVQAAEQRRRDQEKTKAAAAKRAASSVTGAPGPGQSPVRPQERSLREELEANVAELGI